VDKELDFIGGQFLSIAFLDDDVYCSHFDLIARPPAATQFNRQDAKDAKNFFFAPGSSATSCCENIKTFALLESSRFKKSRGPRNCCRAIL
jgi:hypothetical protein